MALTLVDPSVMNPDTIIVRMGSVDYEIRELPIARLKKFKTVFLELFGSMTDLLQRGDLTNKNVVTAIFGLLEDRPAQLLSIIIPSFDTASLDDEENGVTLPQLKQAIDLAITVNGLDVLRRAMPFLAQVGSQAARLRIAQAAMASAEAAAAEEDAATTKTS